MISKLFGERGSALLIEELQRQKLVLGIHGLPEALAAAGVLEEVAEETAIIEQGAEDTDVFFIVRGTFDVTINRKMVARRSAGNEVGEMTAISPLQTRSATVVASEPSLVLKVSEEAFSALAAQFPDMWRRIARELSRRLEQRNALVRTPKDDRVPGRGVAFREPPRSPAWAGPFS